MSSCHGNVNGHAGTFQRHYGAAVSDDAPVSHVQLTEANQREQAERLRLLATAHRLKRERLENGAVFERHARHRPADLQESIAFQDYDFGRLWSDYFDLGKPDSWQFFGPGTLYRRHGANPPFFRTEQELDWLRSASRWVAVRSPHAAGFLGGVGAYVINKGMMPKCVPMDGTNDPADAQLCKLVQRELDEFCERVEFMALQQEIFYDTLIDGEYFLHLFDLGDHVEVRQVLPELVRQPPGKSVDEWGFGIQAPLDDPWQKQAIHVADYTGAAGFISPWSDIIHWPLRIPGRYNRGMKRSMPLFSFGAKDAFEHAEKLLRAMGIGVTIRQGFAFFRQWSGQPRAASTDFAPQADVQLTNSFTNQTRDYRFAEPGAVIDGPEGMQFANLPHSPETGMAIEVADAMLRRGGAIFNVPSWLVSTSGRDQAAYSADLAHDAPFVKRGEQLQEDFGNGFLKIMRRVRDVAVRCGKLPGECVQRVKLTMEHPTLEARNKTEEASRDQIYVGMGVKSKQQVAQEQNLDYDKQRSEIKAAAKDDAAFQREQQAATMGGASVAAGNRPPGGSDTSDAPPAPILPGAEAGGDEPGEDLNPFGDVQESLDLAALMEGFTGTKKDSRGREYHYQDGKRVAKVKDQKTGQEKTVPLATFERTPEVAAQAAGNFAAALSGKLPPQTALAKISETKEQSLAANHKNHVARYNALKKDFEAKFGPDAMASPEWETVRQAFKAARDQGDKHIERMAYIAEAVAEHHAEKGTPVQFKGTDDAALLAKERDELAASGSKSFDAIFAAVEAFKAKYAKVRESLDKPRRKFQRIHRDPLTGDMIGIETVEGGADLLETKPAEGQP